MALVIVIVALLNGLVHGDLPNHLLDRRPEAYNISDNGYTRYPPMHYSSRVLLRPDQTRTTSQIVQPTAAAPEIKPRKRLPDDRLAWSLPREQKPDVSPTAWSNLPDPWRPAQPKPQSQPEVKEEPERGLHSGLSLSLEDAHLATSYILSIGPDLLMKVGKHPRPSLLMRACVDEKVIKGLVKIGGLVNYNNNNQALFTDQASISALTMKWISMLREADAMGDRKKGLIHLMGSVALLLDDQDMFNKVLRHVSPI